jgi:predicted transcriptional regulator
MGIRTQTMVQLNVELVKQLDLVASRAGISRSQLIRQAIEAYLAADEQAQIDREIVDAYTRMPQGGEFDRDEWGDMGGMATALTKESFKNLEQEEQAAGSEPW